MNNKENTNFNLFNLKIDSNAKVIAKQIIEIDAPIETVWNILSNINQWPLWNKDVKKAEAPNTLTIGSVFKWYSSGANIHSEIHTLHAPNVIAWKGKSIGVKAIHNWNLKTDGKKTIVYVEESMNGWLCNLMSSLFNKILKEGMQNQLLALKNEAEKSRNNHS